MPGITEKLMPARASASSSSPPRPKTKGSPPLSRTTRRPCRACSISKPLIAAWVVLLPPEDLPTQIRAASRRARSSTSGDTRRSCRMTSASWSARKAFKVRSSGSPGPAPTKVTSPAARAAPEAPASSCCAIRCAPLAITGDEAAGRGAVDDGFEKPPPLGPFRAAACGWPHADRATIPPIRRSPSEWPPRDARASGAPVPARCRRLRPPPAPDRDR